MNSPKPEARPQAGSATAQPNRVDSRQLFAAGQNTVVIEHAGQNYLLRLTRENKLILTK